jgi:putative polyketide hydroxylase
VIKLCEIWANISDLQSGYKDRRKQKIFGTGYDPKRKSIEEDSTPTRAGRRDGSYCGRPACLRDGGQAMSPDSRHRPQSARVQHRCPGRARQYRACRPGVFLAGDSARIINPPTGGLVGNTGIQDAHNLAWKLRQRRSTARLVPRSTRYTYHNEWYPIGLLSLYAAGLCPFGFRMGQGVEVPHSSTMGR